MKVISPKRLMGSVFPTVRNGSIFNASSLDLQFARTKTLDPRITFTRASSGTYVGSDGLIKTAATNEVRFDHNSTTGESLGLLVEEQRTNLLGRSEEFDEANWAKYSATISANSIAGPNGLSTADTIVSAAATAQTGISRNFTATAAAHTGSFFVKANGANAVQLLWSGSVSTNYANFDLSTGAVAAGTYSAASIQAFPNGWYRISITSTLTSATTGFFLFVIDSTGAARGGSFTGNGTSGVYVWGAQVEAGAFPTSYIPTTTSAVTRSADVVSITGTNFSSWYRQDEGAIQVTTSRVAAGDQRVCSINDASINNRILAFYANTTTLVRAIISSSGSSVMAIDRSVGSISAPVSIATSYKSADFAMSANGGTLATATSGAVPSVTQLQIGAETTFRANATISRLTYWPQRLSNSTLQQITQ